MFTEDIPVSTNGLGLAVTTMTGGAGVPEPPPTPVPVLQLWVLWQPLAALAEATPDIPSRGRHTTTAMATKRTERRRIFTMTSLGVSMGQSDDVDPPHRDLPQSA